MECLRTKTTILDGSIEVKNDGKSCVAADSGHNVKRVEGKIILSLMLPDR